MVIANVGYYTFYWHVGCVSVYCITRNGDELTPVIMNVDLCQGEFLPDFSTECGDL